MISRIIKRSPWIALGVGITWFADPDKGGTRRQAAQRWLEELAPGRSTDRRTQRPSQAPVSASASTPPEAAG